VCWNAAVELSRILVSVLIVSITYMTMLIYCNFVLYIDQGLILGGVFVCCLVQTSSESPTHPLLCLPMAVSLVIKQLWNVRLTVSVC
jgi:hypothetical protein